MQYATKSILAGVLLLMCAKTGEAQDLDLLPRPLVDFQRACTGKEHSGHFQRTGSLRYDCFLPNGDTASLLAASKTTKTMRVAGIVYETHGPQTSQRVKTMRWLGLNEFAHDKLVRRNQGADGCVFMEWHGNLRITVLLDCAHRMTITRMLLLPENAQSVSVENHQN